MAAGVLLLNSRLTFCQDYVSIQGMWDVFRDYIVRYISQGERPVAFILAGKVAKDKIRCIREEDKHRHLILCVYHPAFLPPPGATQLLAQ